MQYQSPVMRNSASEYRLGDRPRAESAACFHKNLSWKLVRARTLGIQAPRSGRWQNTSTTSGDRTQAYLPPPAHKIR